LLSRMRPDGIVFGWPVGCGVAASYSPNTQLLYIPAMTACEFVSIDKTKPNTEKGWIPRSGGSFKVEDRYESNLTAVDPVTFEIKKSVHLRYPNYSGALTTAGGLVFIALMDGTVAAYDDATLEKCGRSMSAPASPRRR
jgi:glucose dehydrogenase